MQNLGFEPWNARACAKLSARRRDMILERLTSRHNNKAEVA
ncbi:hypothetical protein [Mesorhizobium tianshanense]|nr:hypothetical protein [Mesorhizobium tianshanense]